MAERDESHQPTHKAYSVIKREGQDDFWLNLGLAFPDIDVKGFNIMLQAFPLDGKIVVREMSDEAVAEPAAPPRSRQAPPRGGQGVRRR